MFGSATTPVLKLQIIGISVGWLAFAPCKYSVESMKVIALSSCCGATKNKTLVCI